MQVPAKDADKKNLKAVQPVKTEAKTAAKQSKEKEPKEKDDEEAKKIAPYSLAMIMHALQDGY